MDDRAIVVTLGNTIVRTALHEMYLNKFICKNVHYRLYQYEKTFV